MSEEISTCDPSTSKKQPQHHKKIRIDKSKLPTPPPDPRDNKEKDVMEYLENILPNYSRCTSIFAPVTATEEAFDHLDKLYRLMEQMLELREQNARLHRRIRDLEHFNKLEKMRRELEQTAIKEGNTCPDLDPDTAFAETLLESILDSTKKPNQPKTTLKPSILRRNRSGSCADKQVTLDPSPGPSKVSKWTKVKAAFRWEKASTTVTNDNKSQDSGIHVPVNVEIAKYLRVPSTSDETGHSPADSGMAGTSTPGSISTTSSNDDFQRSVELRTPYEDLRSSDEEQSQHYIPHKNEHSPKSHKNLKTPWAKMKDIIHTRNSFKKKHRLSAASDEVQIDIEFCSDNDDNVFEDETKSKTNASSECSSRKNSIPQDILERYQKVLEEEEGKLSTSRWDRVKKAFLNKNSDEKVSKNASSAEDEIQANYKKLQKKLSLEFQEKMSEWERLKQNSPSTSSPSPSNFEDARDPNFMKKIEEWQKIKSQQQPPKSPLPNEFDLPPDFKKKLQEWEKIKKTSGNMSKKKLGDMPKWKSLSGNKYDHPVTFEYPQLSDEFRKKLEEWKQMKASGDVKRFKEKTPSPKLTRKNSSPRHSKKQKETQWFEKELGKIEKEKQRLERERQKFLEREERLSKLRRSIVGGNKKEVLIHTPSGFYRFEGISRKFTQKLYEWEKARGIAPEASTFALLTSSSYAPTTQPPKRTSCATPPMVRSKSADSIAVSALNLTCPLMSHQPSSLSLNDVDELEKECLLDSKNSSLQYLLGSQDLDESEEPQAVLVEVEDYEEETAAPLHTITEKQQLPVYQRQEFKTLCAGETIAAPKVRRSESRRAQTNYNLIEEGINILRVLTENELEVRNIMAQNEFKRQAVGSNKNFQEINEKQKVLSRKLKEKFLLLQEANSSVASLITNEDNSQIHLIEMLEAVQDLSNEIYQMAEKLDQNLLNRDLETVSHCQALGTIKDIRGKILELRRHLSYVCAASDTTVPNRKRSTQSKKILIHKTISNESKSSRCDTSDNNSRGGSQKEDKHYIKSESASNSSQGAVKKRIKYRQKSMQSKTIDTDDDEEDNNVEENKNVRPHTKLSRARTFSESELESQGLNANENSTDSALTVFVKTTRKLFTPIGEASLNVEHSAKQSSQEEMKIALPPLPPSPIPQRKVFKEISPAIRLMLNKYNQKIEHDNKSNKSNSSGSNSPIWRSPTSERRVKAQTEKYQQELNKLSPLLKREVQKSASVGFITAGNKQVTVPLRRDSLDFPVIKHSPEVRQRKLQQAKEDFLNSVPRSAPTDSEQFSYPGRNRLSQISVESDVSDVIAAPGSLMKSASAGMINVDPVTYRQIDPELHGTGCMSLPRNSKNIPPSSKFNFSNIASKFRKVKMRKGKNKDKEMNAVTALCRHSLVVDINKGNAGNNDLKPSTSGGCESASSNSSSRSNSWIKKSLFKNNLF